MSLSGMSCYLGKNHTDFKKDCHNVESTISSEKDALDLIDDYSCLFGTSIL
jgi:hypothetical protein